MGLESATYLDGLNAANPDGAVDPKSQGDNHLRLIKSVLKNTFPGLAGEAWRIQGKAVNYTLAATDNMSVVNVTTTGITLAFTAAATLGNKWHTLVYASGGDVLLDPNGTELINGVQTLRIPAGSLVMIFCDGAGFVMAYLSKNPNNYTQTLTQAASIDWDMSKGNIGKVTLNQVGHTFNAPTNVPPGGFGWFDVIQDATGGRTITTWNSIFKHVLGIAPTLSTAAGARDRFFWSTFDGSAIDLTMAKGMA